MEITTRSRAPFDDRNRGDRSERCQHLSFRRLEGSSPFASYVLLPRQIDGGFDLRGIFTVTSVAVEFDPAVSLRAVCRSPTRREITLDIARPSVEGSFAGPDLDLGKVSVLARPGVDLFQAFTQNNQNTSISRRKIII